MKMVKQTVKSLLLAAILLPAGGQLQAQVTIGSSIKPTRAALLELKTRQNAGVIDNVSDADNVSSETGGMLLPRIQIVNTGTLEPFVSITDGEWTNPAKQKALRMSLAGLMVYNIRVVPGVLFVGVYVWNGDSWAFLTDSKTSSPMTVSIQPESFSFYETGLETAADVADLEFGVIPPKAADGTVGTVSYQWYQLVGSNLHATVGEKIIGATAAAFNPRAKVIKGTTRNARNTGMHRFYCEANGSDGSTLRSDIAEVVVGCGAKDNLGNWISFMCFNLGATKLTIDDQINHTLVFSTPNDANGQHYYIADEEEVYGDLYQWGRIGDGHEKRGQSEGFTPGTKNPGTNQAAYGTGPALVDGNVLGTSQAYPWKQVAHSTPHYGNFILTGAAQNYNWAFDLPVNQIDQLWRTTRFAPNDPCAKINDDGTTYTTYYPPANAGSTAGGAANTGWRTPSQGEWGSIFKGGIISGASTTATANTWVWNTTNGRGMEIQPDGSTTTLFLPANGSRHNGNGLLYSQGSNGAYWSSSTLNSTFAYSLTFSSGAVNPANSSSRGYGFALRCIKN